MKNNKYTFLFILIFSIYIAFINIFSLLLGNQIQFISLLIINLIHILLIAFNIIILNNEFKKNNFNANDNLKVFRKKISESVSNGFIISTLFNVVIILLLYQFLGDILNILNIKTGILNYTIYILKIFIVTIPFLGLEITIFRYFKEINCYNNIFYLLLYKLIIFIILTIIIFFKYNLSSILYSKIITDFIFLYFYTKTCFSITIFTQYKKKN